MLTMRSGTHAQPPAVDRARDINGSPDKADAGRAEKFAAILAREPKWLLAMERYERRALSRRKVPIPAFDDQAAEIPLVVAAHLIS